MNDVSSGVSSCDISSHFTDPESKDKKQPLSQFMTECIKYELKSAEAQL